MSSILKDKILKERPNLSPNTVKTYTSVLTSLHRKVFEKEMKLDDFNDVDKIMKALKDKAPSSRKTTLSALYILTSIPNYRDQMTEDIKTYQDDVGKQEMSEKQKEAFKSQEEIKEILEKLKAEADVLYKKPNMTSTALNTIQNYIILCLTSGTYIPPRRSLDFVLMKSPLKEVDKTKDNYMEKGKFYFNTYKGSDKKGPQVVDIPKPLQQILKKWVLMHNNDTLLFDLNGKPLNSVKLNQRLNKVLGNGSAINVLRHSYLSTKFADTIDMNKKLSETMEAMGSSKAQEKIYVQKIDKK
jgi:23S rRNA pseudoU1915 N3-methylase RlmH